MGRVNEKERERQRKRNREIWGKINLDKRDSCCERVALGAIFFASSPPLCCWKHAPSHAQGMCEIALQVREKYAGFGREGKFCDAPQQKGGQRKKSAVRTEWMSEGIRLGDLCL